MILQFLLESCANQENYVWIYVHSNEIGQILFSGFLSMKLMQNENLINKISMLNSLSFLFLNGSGKPWSIKIQFHLDVILKLYFEAFFLFLLFKFWDFL